MVNLQVKLQVKLFETPPIDGYRFGYVTCPVRLYDVTGSILQNGVSVREDIFMLVGSASNYNTNTTLNTENDIKD